MKKENVIYFRNWFQDYTKLFEFGDENDQRNIRLKIEHTYKVRDAILEIGKSLNLNQQQLLLAETMALFHDVGRFFQYQKYKTFKDSISENHAEISLRELERHQVMDALTDEEKQLIETAILNHNTPQMSSTLDEQSRFYTALLRDADKSDILRVVTSYYDKKHERQNSTIELELEVKDDISEAVLHSFLNGEIIQIDNLRFVHDFKLLQLAWVHDINFDYTLRMILEKQYFDKIIETLPQGDKKQNVIDYFNSLKKRNIAAVSVR
jgi:hypothetical protein